MRYLFARSAMCVLAIAPRSIWTSHSALRSHTYSSGLLPLQQGAVCSFVRWAADTIGYAAPDMGTTQPHAPSTAARRKMPTLIDSTLDQEVPASSFEEAEAAIKRYTIAHGRRPSAIEAATTDQAAALLTLLKTGRTPFTEFRLWTPWGTSKQEAMRFAGWHQEGPTWVQAWTPGSKSHEQWLPCYNVFRTAMLTVDACRPGELDAYREWIQRLGGAL